MDSSQNYFTMLGITLVVCRNSQGKWLAVKETKNRGWWLPGGRVDPPENFFQAALREVKEEAGIDVILKGILRVEYNIGSRNYERVKVIFYAEPKDEQNQKLKSIPDLESEEARWVSIPELLELQKGSPGWRGPELYEWASYLEEGGAIYPLSILAEEGSNVQFLPKKSVKDLTTIKTSI